MTTEFEKQREQVYSKERWVDKYAPEVVRAIVLLNPDISEILLAQYNSFHHSESETTIGWYDDSLSVPRKEVLASWLYMHIAQYANHVDWAHKLDFVDEVLDAASVASEVKLSSGEHAHIPMMDFRTFYIRNTTELTETIRKANFPSGFLLWSGHSYHYYGSSLMQNEEWQQWLSGIQNLPKREENTRRVVDEGWIEKSLERGTSFLRLAPSPLNPDRKYQPRVVCLV